MSHTIKVSPETWSHYFEASHAIKVTHGTWMHYFEDGKTHERLSENIIFEIIEYGKINTKIPDHLKSNENLVSVYKRIR
jgi:hypothetical protein